MSLIRRCIPFNSSIMYFLQSAGKKANDGGMSEIVVTLCSVVGAKMHDACFTRLITLRYHLFAVPALEVCRYLVVVGKIQYLLA